MNELEIVQHRQIEGLTIFLNAVDYRTPHIHPEWELIWVLDQPLSVNCGQTDFVLQPGQMVLFNPNEPHEFRKVSESSTFLCVQISTKILSLPQKLIVEEKLPHQHLEAAEYNDIQNRLAETMYAYLKRGAHYGLYCVGQCCLVMYKLFSNMPTHTMTAEEANSITKRNARLERLIQFVDENYMHKIRLSDFAETEGCSMTHLSHFIKETMNQTFQEYVNSVRFNRACELIGMGDQKMLDVCHASGFSDYRYFSRAFRKHYNMTPEEYARYSGQFRLQSAVVRRSIHSMERFYTPEESIEILKKFA